MKLFLKDHLDIIAIYLLDAVLLAQVYRKIGGFESTGGAAYFLFLSVFLLLMLLATRFFRKRRFYAELSEDQAALEDMVEESSTDPVTNALIDYSQRNYQHYMRRLTVCQEEAQSRQAYTMQWVHRMKTPVSVIHLMVQSPPEEMDTFGILYELDRLQNQMDLMLNLVRQDQFQNDLVLEKVPLKKTIEAVIQNDKRFFIHGEVFPKPDIPEGLFVRTDQKWISFVIEQLLRNAVKYSHAGSLIEITASEQEKGKQLIIRDHGIGIRPRDLPRIFELYYTGSNGRENSQSSGLGLYLVKRILDDLGHTITVTSEEGRGTTVTIAF